MKIPTLSVVLMLSFAPTLVGTRTAYAQSADDPTIKAARARFQEGVDFFDKGQFENARAAFLQAYALRKHPAVLLNLAQSSLKSGHTLEADRYFQQFLRESTTISTAQRSDAEKGLAEARTKLGRIEVSAPTGAEIAVDGDRAGNAPLPDTVDVEPGMHRVTAKGADGSVESRSMTVTAGQQASARFAAGVTSTVPPVTGPVTPPATSGSETPPTTPDAPPTTEEKEQPRSVDSEVATHGRRPSLLPVWIGVGVGAAGFITAIVMGFAKSSAQSNADAVVAAIKANNKGTTSGVCSPPTQRFAAACNTYTQDANNVNTDATIANIGIGVGIAGGALVAYGLIRYFTAPKATDVPPSAAGATASSSLTPVVGPHYSGLAWTGSF